MLIDKIFVIEIYIRKCKPHVTIYKINRIGWFNEQKSFFPFILSQPQETKKIF